MKGEGVLRAPVRQHLEGRGFEVFDEVPILGRFADLLGVSGEQVAAVELKLAQWRIAVGQARAYQLGAEWVYVALPMKRGKAVAAREPLTFTREGIGLLGVDPGGVVEEILPASCSPRLLPYVSQGVIQLVRDRAEEPPLPTLSSVLAELWEASA